MLNDFYQDLHYGVRAIRRSPGLALAAVAALALGIGANTAIFSLVHGILLSPLPYAESDRLVTVLGTEPDHGTFRQPTSPANFLDWKAQSQGVVEMTAAAFWSPGMTGQGRAEQLRGLQASAELFSMLGAEALIGQTFDSSHGVPGNHQVVVLSHGLWQRRFGGDHQIIGQSVTLEGEPHTVLGVMPPGFDFPPFWADDREIWKPLVFDTSDSPLGESTNRGAQYLRVFGRLAPGTDVPQARAEMATIGQGLAAEYPDTNEGLGISVESLREPVVSDVRPALLVLLAAVIAILLIACANVANLMLAHGTTRTREFAIRAALGAERGRLIRQTLTESLLLALLGGGAGLVVSVWAIALLRRLGPAHLPRLDTVGLDWRVLGFTMLLSVVTALVFGLAPALRSARGSVAVGATRGASDGRSGPRRLLVVVECAIALILLVGAGLLLNSFARIMRVEPGFELDDRVAIAMRFDGERYNGAGLQSSLLERIAEDVRTTAGVNGAGLIHALHIGGDTWGITFTAEGGGGTGPESFSASPRVVTSGLFNAMGIPIARGRDFDARDSPTALPVAIINRRLAESFWPDQDPIGKRLKRGDVTSDRPWMTVVAVVGDVHQDVVTDTVRSEVYMPFGQTPSPWYHSATLVVHGHSGPAAIRAAADRTIAAIDPDIPVGGGRTFKSILSRSMASARFNAVLVVTFGVVALVLAAMGIYSVIAFSVGRRTAEIGVRLALGARPREIHRMILGQGVGLAVVGLALGLIGAVGASRFLSTMLFEVEATDPATLATTSALLLVVAGVACYFPARRASVIEPVEALRRN